jgi:DNA-binding IclR family transcriptional regulator
MLHAGFLGALGAEGQALGIDAGENCAGAPVFDRSSRLIGMVTQQGKQARLGPGLRQSSQGAAPVGTATPLARNELYERGLRVAFS